MVSNDSFSSIQGLSRNAKIVLGIASFVVTGYFLVALTVPLRSNLFRQLYPKPNSSAASLPAFPGAEGFGTTTPGGRGGAVVYVTNLQDSGAGSLRDALENRTGPRIVLFKVGGTISLNRPIIMQGESDSFVTVAGQTAPGDGIQVRNHGIYVQNGAHDIVFRFLRIRPGQGSDFSLDTNAIENWGGSAAIYNIVYDHMSLAWSMDENFSVWEGGRNVTIQYSIIAEATTDGQDHSVAKGLLVGADNLSMLPDNISIHHNLFAHNPDRNPRAAYATIDFRNNLIYNWGNNNSTMFGNYQNKSTDRQTQVNVVNNIWKKGPSSSTTFNETMWVSKGAKLFVSGNWGPKCPTGCSGNEWGIGVKFETSPYPLADEGTYRSFQAFSVPAVTTHTTAQLASHLYTNVGAVKPKRDVVDSRIVSEVQQGIGKIGIGSGFQTLQGGTAPIDTDNDGMPDSFEQTKGLNPNQADGNSFAPSGYTWLEEYLNSLVVGSVTPTVTTTPIAKMGDINRDGVVNVFDLGVLTGHYGKRVADYLSDPVVDRSDLNKNGTVDIFDLGMLIGNYNR